MYCTKPMMTLPTQRIGVLDRNRQTQTIHSGARSAVRTALPILMLLSVSCSGSVGPDQGTEPVWVDPNASVSPSVVASVSPTLPTGTVAASATAAVSTTLPTATPSVSVPPVSSLEPPAVNPDGSLPAAMDLQGSPVYTRFMRLTNEQWSKSVQDLLMLDAPPNTALFETPAVQVAEFTNNEELLEVTSTQWQNYELATEAAVQAATATDDKFKAIYAGDSSAEFIAQFGRRAYRRPLTAAETTKYEQVFATGAALSGSQSSTTKGAGLVMEAMLQSPFFLYRSELAEAGQPLNGYELASKLSFWLLGTTPSDALLDKAESGEFGTAEQVAQQASNLLQEPAAAQVVAAFHRELYQFSRFNDVSKTDPAYSGEAMNAELVAASEAFFADVFANNQGLETILTSTKGYVGPELAPLYGLPRPTQLQSQDLGAERAGFFSQIPYLMVFGSQAQSDPIHRGVHIHRDVLCGELGIPSVVVTLLPAQPNQTNRDRVEATTSACGGTCHGSFINPLGYAFENFDGLGRVRATDNSLPVNTSSQYPLPGGTVEFSGAKELMQHLAQNEMAHRCYAKHITGYGLQRDVIAADMPLLDEMASVSLQGGSMKDLMMTLAQNPAFRVRAGGAQ
jgi:Protein of unknown function (DUF1592)/Protein of unknown function (DUF1588)/Protein of unknown function (DUF1595)/Protein of unknown function (DUF1585)/Protein of unknown function (DUF1587)